MNKFYRLLSEALQKAVFPTVEREDLNLYIIYNTRFYGAKKARTEVVRYFQPKWEMEISRTREEIPAPGEFGPLFKMTHCNINIDKDIKEDMFYRLIQMPERWSHDQESGIFTAKISKDLIVKVSDGI